MRAFRLAALLAAVLAILPMGAGANVTNTQIWLDAPTWDTSAHTVSFSGNIVHDMTGVYLQHGPFDCHEDAQLVCTYYGSAGYIYLASASKGIFNGDDYVTAPIVINNPQLYGVSWADFWNNRPSGCDRMSLVVWINASTTSTNGNQQANSYRYKSSGYDYWF